MKFQPAFLLRIRQVMQFTVLWIIAGVLVELNNAINYDVTTRSHYFHFIFGNNAFEHLLITASGPLVGGLFAGSFIVFYQLPVFKDAMIVPKLNGSAGKWSRFCKRCQLHHFIHMDNVQRD